MKNSSLIIFTLLFSSPVWSADVENGQTLHEENCVRCHDSSAYTRTDRKVNDLKQLGVQVRACKDNLGLTWFDDEVDDVILFVNQKYYHF